MFADDGWRFSLDDFPAAASNAGPIKEVLGLALPKAILGDSSFQELAATGRDYQQAIFRLPLRRTVGTGSADQHGPVFPGASFPDEADRNELLREMCDEAKRSLLFLKSLRRVVFGGIAERRFDEWACIEATRRPPSEMVRFAETVRAMKDGREQARRVGCSFRCDVSVRVSSERIRATPGNAAFQITHVADFTDSALTELAEKLRKNGERAVPWVATAIPLDASSFDWEGGGNARWRVFLPLVEEGPSACILNAATFVDPSRRSVEFRTDGSDETLRKSQWNRALVERLLVPLLRDASTIMMYSAPQLIEQEPKKYLSLFPSARDATRPASCLADIVQASFSEEQWLLKLYDVWTTPFDVEVGPGSAKLRIEKVPEWLGRYKEAFRELSSDVRRFVAWNVGDAVDARLGDGGNVEVRKTGADVPDHVLLANQCPKPKDLQPLLKLLGEAQLGASSLEGRWALQQDGAEGSLLRFDSGCLYLVRTQQTPQVYESLRATGISFEKAEWVAPDVGLSDLRMDLAKDLANIRDADEGGAVELLRRTGSENRHDVVSDYHKIVSVVEFLCSQNKNRLTEDLRLAFLIKTAAVTVGRRHLGVVFLRPERPSPDEEELWQGLLRRTFAAVDPQFAPHVRRLLDHAPHLLTCLGDDVCEVRLAKGVVLDLLHKVRTRDGGFVGRLAEQVSRELEGAGDRRTLVYRAARLVILEADRRWDSIEQPLRDTLLALPIHRTADGDMTCLLPDGEVPPDQVHSHFFLQSGDDLRDAPLQLPAGQLLHSLDVDLRRFYRLRLGIREQGRTEILKECLRQIGADASRSSGILKYVARHYSDSVEQLRERGAEGAEDLRELDGLYRSARGVLCLDGNWRPASECVDAGQLRHVLASQGFHGPRLDELLCTLSYPQPVAETGSDAARLALDLWDIQKLDRDRLAELAITSESPGIEFADRIRVIADNLKLVPETPPKRAVVIGSQICVALGGPVELAKLVLVDPGNIGLGNSVVRAIVPEAADLPSLAAKFTKGRVSLLAGTLHAIGVPTINGAGLRSRTLANFGEIWSRLDTGGRLALLAWLANDDTTLPADAPNLATVLVGEGDGTWASPSAVIAPSWTTPTPPNVPAASIAHTDGVPQQVLRLWDRWCGVHDLEGVVGYVVRKTSELPREQWPAAAKQLACWLEELAGQKGAIAVTAALRSLRWMFARRGDDFTFQLPNEVLDHLGAEVLRHEFWVVAEGIPTSLARHVETRQLEGSRGVLEAISRCLTHSSSARPETARSVYESLVEMTSEERTKEVWRTIARSTPVYRLFRTGVHGPDRLVLGEELFLGDQEIREDFGQVLYCFGSGDDRRKTIAKLYRKLGVAGRPDAKQLVGALSRLPHASHNPDVHRKLVDVLTGLSADDLQDLREVDLRNMKVLSCAKTNEPLDHCYTDPDLDRPSRLVEGCREKLVDGRISSNHKLLAWLDSSFPGVVAHLRLGAVAGLTCEAEPVEVLASNVLDAWREWLADLAVPGSVVRDDVETQGFVVPAATLQILVVAKLHVRYRLPDGSDIVPSEEWVGPKLFHDAQSRVIIRRDVVDQDFLGRVDDVEKLDDDIADELERLLRSGSTHGASSSCLQPFGALRETIRRTLERPGALLRRMKAERQEHFLHQYLDQTADPEFSHLFDEYRRISASASERRRLKEEEMLNLISLRFVKARRDQIRGYGYDEFAIFAELVQNAEDAYASADQLGLPEPPSRGVTFSYLPCDGARTLTAAHYGRPFNLWRYGSNRIEAFRNDVEGVLKSAGSFKPYSGVVGASPIGRFGLGFKSVYLVTDAPRIHSGDWHFKITAGCIPKEIPIPTDYTKGLTKVVLPLTASSHEERDGERGRFANLLPFLRHVDKVHLLHSDGTRLDLRVTSKTLLRTTKEYVVDQVFIEGARHVAGGTIRFLRARQSGHEGQLAVLLASDGLPVRWSEAFDADVFAVLPLRPRLGCGVGVSNHFEVQSGRTHLIDPAGNAPLVVEVAQALQAVVKALIAENASIPGPAMTRFWAIWRWDRGDEEAQALRLHLARELAALSRNAAIIPTLDPQRCVKFDGTALFSFDGIPEELASTLLDQAVEFPFHGTYEHLQKGNVIPEPIRSAVLRTYMAAQDDTPIAMSRIGWPDLGEVFLAKSWLEPELVSAMARSLPQEKLGEVRPWLCKCRFQAGNGEPKLASTLLPPGFPGAKQLPLRPADQLHESYDEEAVSLLKQVGLPSRPPLERIKFWVRSGLQEGECCNLLRYLSDAGRWRRDYYELGSLLTGPWFASNRTQLTTAEAFRQGLVPIEELDPDPAFRAWLGIDTGPLQINLDATRWDRPVADPKKALEMIWAWWSKDSVTFVRRYEQQTYPHGAPPQLQVCFAERDFAQRENWLSLFILGALHTMGRTKREQHRGFLEMCRLRGWMEVFADLESTAEQWIHVLDRYLDEQTNDSLFYHWVRQFVSIYQIARSLPEYVGSFLDIDKHDDRFDFDEILKSRNASSQSGGGWDAPPLTRTLGIGACFVVRELVRTGVLTSRHAHDHAYVGVGSVRNVFVRLGMSELRGEGASYRHSSQIHRFLLDHLGPDRAHFDRCFDLPFLAIAESAELQRHFLDCHLPAEEE
jgi:hypothetical protein